MSKRLLHVEDVQKGQTRRMLESLGYNATDQAVTATVEAQKTHTCHICGARPEKRLCVDHDHATGLFRGLLCDRCNRALGGFKDDPKLLFEAIRYLHQAEVIQMITASGQTLVEDSA